MSDLDSWATAQENEFPNFPNGDSFNLSDMTGLDGKDIQFFYLLFIFFLQ